MSKAPAAFMALTILFSGALAVAPVAMAQHAAPAPPSAGATQSLQGDQAAWIKDPHWRQYYDLTRAAFANGPDKVDMKTYTEKSYAIFGDFGVAHGMPREHMIDHLKLIPGQIVQIVREDPHVLDTYDNFIAAAFGPQ